MSDESTKPDATQTVPEVLEPEPKQGAVTTAKRTTARKAPAEPPAVAAAAPSDPFSRWLDAGFKGAAALAECGEVIGRELELACVTVSRHGRGSVERALTAQARVASCRDLLAVTDVQAQWVSDQVGASANEIAELADRAVTLPHRVAAPIRTRAGEVGWPRAAS